MRGKVYQPSCSCSQLMLPTERGRSSTNFFLAPLLIHALSLNHYHSPQELNIYKEQIYYFSSSKENKDLSVG